MKRVALAAALSAFAGVAALAQSGDVRARSGDLLGITSESPPTFSNDVAPIVYTHCAVCHRPGQAAPFPLLSYNDVKKRAVQIAQVTARHYMPPWHAAESPEFPEFRDDRRLSNLEIETLGRWVDSGTPSGNLARAPSAPVFEDGWTLGRPDVVLSFPRAIDVPADGPDLYRNIVLALDLPDDRWITALDYEPSARTVVHHALFFLAPAADAASIGPDDALPGLGARALLSGRGPGVRGSGPRGSLGEAPGGIGGWVPGMTPRFFPDGIAQSLPAHTSIVAQLHLHPSGKAEHEHGRLAIYFSRKPPSKSLTGVQVPPTFGFGMGIDIPPGEKRYLIKDSFVLPVDVEALGARGHAHYIARDMKLTATLPDGSTKGLLWVSDWDFGWQDSYFFRTPFTLPKGTRLDVVIAYDNSAENPRNPNTPPKRVRWGRGSLDEMGSMTLLTATSTAEDAATLRQAQAQHFRQQLAALFLHR